MVIDFRDDWEIDKLGDKEVDQPNFDLSVENEQPGNILKKPCISNHRLCFHPKDN